MSEQHRKSESLSLPGLVVVCAAIVLATYFLGHPKMPPPRRLWIPAVVEKDGTLTVLGETRQMSFWTPSVQTKDYLTTNENPTNEPNRWQVLSNDEPLIQFGMFLRSNADVFGYRRTEVWGHGRSFFKPGWWWSVNVSTNFSAVDMGRTYQNFWKCSAPVFIEVVESRGSEP